MNDENIFLEVANRNMDQIVELVIYTRISAGFGFFGNTFTVGRCCVCSYNYPTMFKRANMFIGGNYNGYTDIPLCNYCESVMTNVINNLPATQYGTKRICGPR